MGPKLFCTKKGAVYLISVDANGELNARNLFEVHPIRHELQLVSPRIRLCMK